MCASCSDPLQLLSGISYNIGLPALLQFTSLVGPPPSLPAMTYVWQKTYTYKLTCTWDPASGKPPEMKEDWSEAQPYVEGSAKAVGKEVQQHQKKHKSEEKKARDKQRKMIRKELHKEERMDRKAAKRQQAMSRTSESVLPDGLPAHAG